MLARHPIYIATPSRFAPGRGDSPSYDQKDVNHTDVLFLSSRAGATRYDRIFTEPLIRPGLDPACWRNRANYVALNVIPTRPEEMSIYHWSGDLSALAGQPVRLRFVMKESAVYSYRFR